MKEIIKQAGPSGQLFETVNFAFMKIFDFLIKIALFGAFLFFLSDLCHKLRVKIELGGYIFSSFISENSHSVKLIALLNKIQIFSL